MVGGRVSVHRWRHPIYFVLFCVDGCVVANESGTAAVNWWVV